MSVTPVATRPPCRTTGASPAVVAPVHRRDPGLVLIWLSALFAIVAVYLADADLRLDHPAVLLPMCLGLLLPVRRSGAASAQAAVFLYLMWLFFAAAFDVVWTVPSASDRLQRLSITVPAIILMGAGWALRRVLGFRFSMPCPNLTWALLLWVVVIGSHALFLRVLLWRVYGYGWEEDAAVFGRIGLLVIVLCGLGPLARCCAMRGSLALAAAIVLSIRSLS